MEHDYALPDEDTFFGVDSLHDVEDNPHNFEIHFEESQDSFNIPPSEYLLPTPPTTCEKNPVYDSPNTLSPRCYDDSSPRCNLDSYFVTETAETDFVEETEEQVMGTPLDINWMQTINLLGTDEGDDGGSVAQSVASAVEPTTDTDTITLPSSSTKKRRSSNKFDISSDRRVPLAITDEQLDYIKSKNIPVHFRIMKSSGREKTYEFKKNQFLRKDTEWEPDSEIRTDIDISTGNELCDVHRKIDIFLATINPQEYLDDKHNNDAKLFCKSLKQIDLSDIRTNVNKVPNESEPGGTKQILKPITSTRVFLAAVLNIAYKERESASLLTQTTIIQSYVLDIFITISTNKKNRQHHPTTGPRFLVRSLLWMVSERICLQ